MILVRDEPEPLFEYADPDDDRTFRPGDRSGEYVLGEDMTWRRSHRHRQVPDPTSPGAGGVRTSVLVVIAACLVVLVIFVISTSIIGNVPQGTPPPAPTATETVIAPEPSSDVSGYRMATLLIGQVWADMEKIDQTLMCQGWEILPRSQILEQLSSGMKGRANENIGISDADYRRASIDFFDKECA